VQIGTAFALCDESGLMEKYRRALLQDSTDGKTGVFTDPLASPTRFPFKVARLEGSLSEESVFAARERVCDLGFLREAYYGADGAVRYRCPSEPVDTYVAKGGTLDDTVGRKCLCNALVANIGHPQRRSDGRIEPPLVTAGDDLRWTTRFLRPDRTSYSARDVIEQLLGIDPEQRATAASESELTLAG
jgi:nitronate monooxygenase